MKGILKALAVLAALFVVAVGLFHAKKGEAEKRSENRLEIYYMYNEGEPQSLWLLDAAERFEKLHPGLEIDLVFTGRELLGKVRPRFIMGNPPDLLNQGGDVLRTLMLAGLLEPLDDFLAESAWDRDMPWRDVFIPGLLDLYSYQGKTYQVPVGLFCSVVFYDKTMFERLGLTEPRMWKEFLGVCQVLKDNGIEPIASDGTEIGYNVMWYSVLVTRTAKVEHIRRVALGEEGTSWSEEPFVAAARLAKELVDRGYIMKGYEGSGWPAAQNRWAQGECALLYNGTWIPKEMGKDLPETFRMGMFRFPLVEGYEDADGMAQDIGAECFAVPAQAKNKEMAVEFLKFITTLEECERYVELDIAPAVVGGGMPESLSGLEELLSPPHTLMRGVAGISAQMPEWYRIVARDLMSDLFLGRIEPEEMCRRMDAEQGRYYERLDALGKERLTGE